ncbi:heparinase II/III family protein [Oceanivirga salmonicida]|uniref:heparinase II/III family protein n=1 Tax=Oceanivirga salmonicida TaxID=1769291 RepID=UPI0012E1F56D|nr:heparinase II/III family protein [Oceanivirga salmonicida]
MQNYLKQADELLNDIYSYINPTDMERCREKYKKPSDFNVSPNGDEEWIFMRTRMGYLKSLILAYETINDIVYINKIYSIIDEYIENHREIKISLSTRTLDLGIFLENVIKTIDYLKENKLISKERLKEYISYMKKVCEYLFENYMPWYDQSNWGFIQMSSIYMYSYKYNELKFMEKSFKYMKKQLKCQVEKDGFHYERSTTYHYQILICLQNLVKLNSDDKEYFMKYLKKMTIAASKMYYPNMIQINCGDSDEMNVSEILKISYELMGEKFIHKNHTSLLKHSGYFNMIKEDFSISSYLTKMSSGHIHLDLAHFNYYNKKPIIVDNGRYTYREIEQRLDLKSVYAHNTIVIDNNPYTKPLSSWEYDKQYPKVNNIDLEEISEDVKIVTMSYYDSRNSAYIERKLIIIEKNLIVQTNVFCKGKHKLKLNFNLHPNIEIKDYILDNRIKFTGKNLSMHKSKYSKEYNIIENSLKIEDNIEFNDEAYLTNMVLEDEIEELEVIRENKVINSDYVKAYILKSKKKDYIIFMRNKDEYIGTNSYYVNNEPKYNNLVIDIMKKNIL